MIICAITIYSERVDDGGDGVAGAAVRLVGAVELAVVDAEREHRRQQAVPTPQLYRAITT